MVERLSRQFEDISWWDERPMQSMGDEFAVDVVDEPDEVVVTVDVPGFDRNEIDVRVDDRTLWIEATREEAVDEGDDTYLRRERSRRFNRRSITLPAEGDPEDVEATLRNGVLTVTIPKATPSESVRHIEIDSG